MFSIDIECAADLKDLRVAEFWEAGCTGIVELGDSGGVARMRAFFSADADRAELIARFGGEAKDADNRDWVAFAREHLQPMEIGEKIFVVPEWRGEATPPGRIRIEVNAGLAFGTGAHETTRMCLEALERHVHRGMTVIDVGTGSGILSEASVKLGAARALLCDTDPDAVEVARENLARAGVAGPGFVGSADAIAGNCADLIVANISPAWVAELAPEWVRILKPGGVAILSGFEASDLPVVGEALKKAGGEVAVFHSENEWRAIEMTRAVVY